MEPLITNLSWATPIDVKEMRAIELNSEFLGVSTLMLMENAGRSVAEVISSRVPKDHSILIVAGKGGKAGDGFAAARHLDLMGFNVAIALLYPEDSIKHRDAVANLNIIKNGTDVDVVEYDSGLIGRFNVIVDSILGIGIRGAVRGVAKEAIDTINNNRSGRLIVSIDAPSGIDPNTGEVLGVAVKADITVTLHAPKKGLIDNPYVGELIVADIGVPKKATTHVGPGDVVFRVRRKARKSRKGDYGRTLVIAGSEKYYGAPWISALASWASGTDLVYLAAPKPVAEERFSPEIIVVELPGSVLVDDHFDMLKPYIEKASSILVGPGIGLERETERLVARVIAYAINGGKPIVIDADALKMLPGILQKYGDLKGKAILTPHLGEASHITGSDIEDSYESRKMVAERIAREAKSITILKGYIDFICNPEGVCKERSLFGSPDMTRGGTGDVLAGLVAGLVNRCSDLFDAALSGVYINAAAGILALKRFGHSSPLKLIELIPKILIEPPPKLEDLI